MGGEAQKMKLFDGYMAVDWSANGKPKQGKDSIWIASRGAGGAEALENPATRREAVRRIEDQLEKATAAGWRLLVGFDFPFGYPVGTAQMLTGRAGWEAVWSRIAEVIEDDSRNKNNRFDAAALLNTPFVGEGPFWGNGLSRDIPGLSGKKPRSGWGVNLPANLRHAESEVRAVLPGGPRGLETQRRRVGRRPGADRNCSAGGTAEPYRRANLAVRDTR